MPPSEHCHWVTWPPLSHWLVSYLWFLWNTDSVVSSGPWPPPPVQGGWTWTSAGHWPWQWPGTAQTEKIEPLPWPLSTETTPKINPWWQLQFYFCWNCSNDQSIVATAYWNHTQDQHSGNLNFLSTETTLTIDPQCQLQLSLLTETTPTSFLNFVRWNCQVQQGKTPKRSFTRIRSQNINILQHVPPTQAA